MNNRRVAIVAGCRTPFARSGTVYRDMTAVDLGTAAVRELLERTEIDPAAVGMVVMGQVVPSVKAPNLGREVVLRTPLPRSVPAHTVNRACASANEAIVEVVSAILLGQVDVGIAGGAESLSDVPILHSKRMSRALVEAQKARSLGERLGIFARLRPRDLVPQAPAIAEPSTGLTMGQSAEKMAKENGISRREQDEIALASHRNAARAAEEGRLGSETTPVLVPPVVRHRGHRRQPDPQGHVDGGARVAGAGLRQALRHRDRRQLVAAHRRRRRGASDGRGQGSRRGPRAARLRPLVGDRGGGPRRAAADGPRARDTARPSSAPASSCRTWT